MEKTPKENKYKKPVVDAPAHLDDAAPKVESGLAVPTPAGALAPVIHGAVEGIPAGFENMESDDLVIPRLCVVQSMSKVKDNDNAAAPKEGQFYNTATLDKYDAPLGGIVPVLFKKAAIKFGAAPGDPIDCKSNDGVNGSVYGKCAECEYNHAKWDGENAPLCTGIREFYCAFENDETQSPFVISFMKTSANAGRKWISTARLSAGNGAPLFAFKYKLDRTSVKGDKGAYYVLNVKPDGRVADPSKYETLYRSLYEAFKAGSLAAQSDDDLPI